MRKHQIALVVFCVLLVAATLLWYERGSLRRVTPADQELLGIQGGVEAPVMSGGEEYRYGTGPKEDLVVYRPLAASQAPILVMVHGGGWQIGDKNNAAVVANKVAYWVPKGYLFVSVNYPMIAEGATPDKQAAAVANALAYIQSSAAAWGGDAGRMVVMGHSAGAHLVALVSATQKSRAGLLPWSGTILLDGAGYDIVATMQDRPSEIYRAAFGADPVFWESVSPMHALTSKVEPAFVVCSSVRAKRVCEGAGVYAEKLRALGTDAELYPVALAHDEVNKTLGSPSAYTTTVDRFIETVLSR